jgi:amidophosphoribosyltransferase
MPTATELIAHDRTEEEVCELIGADWLLYQDLDDLVASSQGGNPDVQAFDCSVFDGKYVTGDVNEAYFARLEAARSDKSKSKNSLHDDSAGIGLHNDEAM